MKTVITYGTFDLLHIGHINLLQRAKSLGDKLIVALSTDEFNASMKSKHCIQPYAERKLILESFMFVDMVIPEESWEQKVTDVQKHDVDVFVIGKDWEGKFDFLKTQCDVVYLERTEGVSTTERKLEIVKIQAHTDTSEQIHNNCVIVFCITKDFIFAAANMIIGLMRHSPTLADSIFIYHDGISENDKENLHKLTSKIIFIRLDENVVLSKLDNGVTEDSGVKSFINCYSMLMFAKFEAIDLLNQFNHVLILDVDMLIQNDISDILAFGPIAARPIMSALASRLVNVHAQDLDATHKSPNIGVLLLSRGNHQLTSNLCYSYFNKYYKNFRPGALDESIFGYMLYVEKIHFTALDVEWNCYPAHKNAYHALIVHGIGPKMKFWNNQSVFSGFMEWNVNNRLWEKISNTRTQHLKGITINRNLMIEEDNLLYWERVFSQYLQSLPMSLQQLMQPKKGYYIFFIDGINKHIHFELGRVGNDKLIKLSLHCEDKSKLAQHEVASLFQSIEIATSEFGIVFTKNNRENRLECAVVIKIEQLSSVFNTFVEIALPFIYETQCLFENNENMTLKHNAGAYEKSNVRNLINKFLIELNTVQKNQHTLENKVKEVATVLTAKYVEEHMTMAIAVNSKYDLLKTGIDAAQTEGAYFEFGVSKGVTLKHIAKLVADKSVYGFDSFEGLPEDWRASFQKGCFATTIPQLSAEYPNIKLVIGLFRNSLAEFLKSAEIDKCSFIHIDCDLYSSTKTVLNSLASYIVRGTVIVFDDYFNYPGWRNHEFKAFQEFVSYHGIDYEYVGYVNNGEQVCVRIN